MESCCTVELGPRPAPAHCPECGKPGRAVERITVKALLHPEALERLSAPEHRFCATPGCPVVYFGNGETFDRGDVRAPVFQKEPAGARTVCYCFAVTEEDIRRELEETGRSSALDRITDLVKKDRCACEVRNPQGSCCLGNVALVTKAAKAAREDRTRDLSEAARASSRSVPMRRGGAQRVHAERAGCRHAARDRGRHRYRRRYAPMEPPPPRSGLRRRVLRRSR